jgi:hypothetical protein
MRLNYNVPELRVLRRTCELKGTMTECRNRVKTS